MTRCILCMLAFAASGLPSFAQRPAAYVDSGLPAGSGPYVPATNVSFADGASPTAGPRFYAEASVIAIVPYFESNPAYLLTSIRSQGPGTPAATIREQAEFDYDYALSPRIVMGVESCDGLGIRGRWWRYDQSAPGLSIANNPIPLGSPTLARTVEGVSPLMSSGPQTGLPAVFSLQQQGVPAGTDILAFTSGLRMDAWDLEATLSDMRMGLWSFVAAGGARYSQLRQTYNSFLQGAVPQQLVSRQSFDGVGPTAAIEASRPLVGTGLSIFGDARLAMLFGEYSHTIEGRSLGLTPPFALQDQLSTVSRQRFLPVIELEMGGEYARPIGAAQFVVRGSVLSQLWPAGNGAHGYGNMGLIGFSLTSGFLF